MKYSKFRKVVNDKIFDFKTCFDKKRLKYEKELDYTTQKEIKKLTFSNLSKSEIKIQINILNTNLFSKKENLEELKHKSHFDKISIYNGILKLFINCPHLYIEPENAGDLDIYILRRFWDSAHYNMNYMEKQIMNTINVSKKEKQISNSTIKNIRKFKKKFIEIKNHYNYAYVMLDFKLQLILGNDMSRYILSYLNY